MSRSHAFLLLFTVLCTMKSVMAKLDVDHLSTRIVTTKYGRMRGILVEFEDPKLQTVEAYLGVEYASLHGGALRFMPPSSPVEKWQGVKIANFFRPVCPQKSLDFKRLLEEMPLARVERLRRISEFTRVQSEDCLSLNVYIPARERTGPAPVVVIVHGESYEFGTGNAFDGSVLASYSDVAVVTLNYRLGALGFLSTGDSVTSGNYALYDLIAALHWLQSNVADFGGDATKVTVMGQGHGAALANLLSLSPIAKRLNLFQRLILQSGSAIGAWAMAGNPRQTTNKLAESVNCLHVPSTGKVANSGQMVVCLRNVSADRLVNANISDIKYMASYGPVVDNGLLELIPEALMQLNSTLFSSIPVMFGVSKYEGSVLLSEKQLEEGISSKQKQKLTREYVMNAFQVHQKEIYNILTHHYSDWDSIEQEAAELKHKMIELLGDGQFNVPAVLTGRYHLKHGKETFFYVFSHSSRYKEFPNWQGGHHGEEMAFVLGAPLGDFTAPFVGDYSKAEQALSEAAMRFWGNFIKSGNPNIPLIDRPAADVLLDNLRFLDVYWPAYEQSGQQYLQLGLVPLVSHHYRSERIALWTELIPKLLQKETGNEDFSEFRPREGSVSAPGILGESRMMDVRHVLPPPPTPPILPPPPHSWVHSTTKGGLQLMADGSPEVKATVKPSTQTIQDIEFVKKELEKEIVPEVTLSSAKTEPSQEKPEFKMTLSLSVTIAVGCALLFLNISILVGICCQRDKLRTERKYLEKLRDTTGQVRVASNGNNYKPQGHKDSQQLTVAEDQLFDKVTVSLDRLKMMSSSTAGNSDRDSMASNRPTGRSPLHEVQSPLPSQTIKSRSSLRGQNVYGEERSSTLHSRSTNADYPSSSLRSGSEGMTPQRVYPDPPHEYSGRPQHMSALLEPDADFQICNNYKRSSLKGKSTRSNYNPGSDRESDIESTSSTCRRGNNEVPTPRQRTPDRPHGQISAGRSSLDCPVVREPGHGMEESRYKSPRRLQSEDRVSSDSGVQHMNYGLSAV